MKKIFIALLATCLLASCNKQDFNYEPAREMIPCFNSIGDSTGWYSRSEFEELMQTCQHHPYAEIRVDRLPGRAFVSPKSHGRFVQVRISKFDDREKSNFYFRLEDVQTKEGGTVQSADSQTQEYWHQWKVPEWLQITVPLLIGIIFIIFLIRSIHLITKLCFIYSFLIWPIFFAVLLRCLMENYKPSTAYIAATILFLILLFRKFHQNSDRMMRFCALLFAIVSWCLICYFTLGVVSLWVAMCNAFSGAEIRGIIVVMLFAYMIVYMPFIWALVFKIEDHELWGSLDESNAAIAHAIRTTAEKQRQENRREHEYWKDRLSKDAWSSGSRVCANCEYNSSGYCLIHGEAVNPRSSCGDFKKD